MLVAGQSSGGGAGGCGAADQPTDMSLFHNLKLKRRKVDSRGSSDGEFRFFSAIAFLGCFASDFALLKPDQTWWKKYKMSVDRSHSNFLTSLKVPIPTSEQLVTLRLSGFRIVFPPFANTKPLADLFGAHESPCDTPNSHNTLPTCNQLGPKMNTCVDATRDENACRLGFCFRLRKGQR